MRGKDSTSFLLLLVWGITPAYAGKSHSSHICRHESQDHPRLCGEKHQEIENVSAPLGSPPPMRGKDKDDITAFFEPRITPAYAGKSCNGIAYHSLNEDHPRLCGEKRRHSSFVYDFIGSPPPMRGKAMSYTIPAGTAGITPAYAGKRDWHVHEATRPKDHPRLCGEKHPLLPPPFHDIGSPPPMRGKALHAVENAINLRITPAYAGKRGQLSDSVSGQWDHPRLCGEKLPNLLSLPHM